MSQITITIETRKDHQVISLDQIIKRREQRRRRVAKRLAKRFPMFAVEMMQDEFPGYTQELFEADINRKSRKAKSYRKPKSPLKKMGRYPEMQRMLSQYHFTGDQKYLQAAQQLRNRMWLPFIITKIFGRQQAFFQLPAEISIIEVKRLTNEINDCQSYEEAKTLIDNFIDNFSKY